MLLSYKEREIIKQIKNEIIKMNWNFETENNDQYISFYLPKDKKIIGYKSWFCFFKYKAELYFAYRKEPSEKYEATKIKINVDDPDIKGILKIIRDTYFIRIREIKID